MQFDNKIPRTKNSAKLIGANIDGGNSNCDISSNDIVQRDPTNIFPNPVENVLQFSWPVNGGVKQTEIINMFGKIVSKPVQNGQNVMGIDVSNLPDGMYGLRFYLDGKKVVRKFIKM